MIQTGALQRIKYKVMAVLCIEQLKTTGVKGERTKTGTGMCRKNRKCENVLIFGC